jgi:hypothetical protein
MLFISDISDMRSAYIAIGSIMLTFGAVMIISLTNQAPQLNASLSQLARIVSTSQNQCTQLLFLGQKLTPIFALAGAVFLEYGIRAKQ